jgi:hypothetical protein
MVTLTEQLVHKENGADIGKTKFYSHPLNIWQKTATMNPVPLRYVIICLQQLINW